MTWILDPGSKVWHLRMGEQPVGKYPPPKDRVYRYGWDTACEQVVKGPSQPTYHGRPTRQEDEELCPDCLAWIKGRELIHRLTRAERLADFFVEDL